MCVWACVCVCGGGALTPCPEQSAGRCRSAWSSQTWSRWCVGGGTDWSLRTTGSRWPAEAWWCSPWTAGCSRDAFSFREQHRQGRWNCASACVLCVWGILLSDSPDPRAGGGSYLRTPTSFLKAWSCCGVGAVTFNIFTATSPERRRGQLLSQIVQDGFVHNVL